MIRMPAAIMPGMEVPMSITYAPRGQTAPTRSPQPRRPAPKPVYVPQYTPRDSSSLKQTLAWMAVGGAHVLIILWAAMTS